MTDLQIDPINDKIVFYFANLWINMSDYIFAYWDILRPLICVK